MLQKSFIEINGGLYKKISLPMFGAIWLLLDWSLWRRLDLPRPAHNPALAFRRCLRSPLLRSFVPRRQLASAKSRARQPSPT